MIRSLILVLCMCASISALAQKNSTLCYKIIDGDSVVLSKATVRLLRAGDSVLIKGTLSNAEGEVVFVVQQQQAYIVEARYVGYSPTFLSIPNVERDSVFYTVVMTKIPVATTGVTVQAERAYIEQLVDRTVITVDALKANEGRTVYEVLSQSPGIVVDNNGSITMKGKPDVVVYIDDKPTYLSGEQLQQYLSSIPASMADKIELLPNPPSMYDAAGNAGIINIVLKRVSVGGTFGSVSVGYNQGRYARSNNAFNLTVNKPDFSVFSNVGVGVVNSFQDLTIYRNYKLENGVAQSSFVQNSILRSSGVPINARVAVDWYYGDNTVVGISCRGTSQQLSSTSTNNAEIRLASQELVNVVTAANRNEPMFQSLFSSINYRHSFDSTGKRITADADYVLYKTRNNQEFRNELRSADQSRIISDQLRGLLPIDIAIYTLKSDVILPLQEDGIEIQGGIKTAYSTTENTAEYFTVQAGVTTPNYALSNRFLYNESITAAYANVQGALWNSLQYQVGLRVEHTAMNGTQVGNPLVAGSTFTRAYTNVFPTLFLQTALGSNSEHIINASYGRRIDRPIYQELNPFISPLDKYTFYTGNPFLIPSLAHNFSLSYNWKNLITNTFEINSASNGSQETIEIRDSIYYSKPANISSFTQYSLQTVIAAPLAEWWRSTLVTEGGLMQFSDNSAVKNLQSQRWYVAVNLAQSFSLSDTWSAELSGNARTAIALAQLDLGAVGQANIAFKKVLFEGKGAITFMFNDILLTQKPFGAINNIPNVDAGWNSILDTRQAAVSFSYKFGSTSLKRDPYNGSGSEGERQRVKQG